MGIVNLLDESVWSEADVVAYTEARIRSAFPAERQDILSRKMTAFMMGRLIPTSEEQGEVIAFEAIAYAAQADGFQIRADMAIKQSAMDVEAASWRLAQPLCPATLTDYDANGEAIEVPHPGLEQDGIERAAAQAVLDAATPDVLDLVALRTPPEPDPIPDPQTPPTQEE